MGAMKNRLMWLNITVEEYVGREIKQGGRTANDNLLTLLALGKPGRTIAIHQHCVLLAGQAFRPLCFQLQTS